MNRKKRRRIWSRVISWLLILALFVNDSLGSGLIVWAAEQETAADTAAGGEASSGEDEAEPVLISEEDTSMRSANIKYFINEDHSYTAAVYSEPVHYLEDGEWKEINNQLADGGVEEGTDFLENQENSLSVKFAKKSNGSKLVKLKLDDYQISWQLDGASKVDAVLVDSISTLEEGLPHTEEGKDAEEEPLASILTENPDAAASGITDVEEAEEKFGNLLSKLPENNTTQGILPEEQEEWQGTNDEDEETLDADHYASIENANEKKMKVKDLSSGVVYEEILPDVDLEYQVISQRVKENIILKSADAQTEFTFQFKMNGLTPVQEGNSVLLQDEEGNTVFEMQAPYMYDANGENSQKVTLELIPGNGKKFDICLTVDEEWLRAEGRAFPVVVDPAIETDQESTTIKDAHVLSNYPTSNYINSEVLKTGVSEDGGIARSYLKFTLPTLNSGDMVVDARMNLYCYSTSSSQVTVSVHGVYSEWSSDTITWENQPFGGATDITDYQVFTPQNGDPITFNITKLV